MTTSPYGNRIRFRWRAPCAPAFLNADAAEHADDVPGEIVAIESYAGSIPTFSWRSDAGHLFTYLPACAFSRYAWTADFACPPGPIVGLDWGFDDGGCGVVGVPGTPGATPVVFKRVLLSVDWPEDNMLAHLVLDKVGALQWIRNSRIRVGVDATELEAPRWKKNRGVWKPIP